MNVYPINEEAGYKGSGKAWAAIVDGHVVALRYMERTNVRTADGWKDTWGGREFAEYREYAKAELAAMGEVVSGMARCWEFCANGASEAVRELPADPDRQNDERAEWAQNALAEFSQATGADGADALTDLLADLMHLSDRNATDFEEMLKRARGHYREETDAEELEKEARRHDEPNRIN